MTKTIFFLYKNTPLSCSEERLVNSEDEEESALLVYKVMNWSNQVFFFKFGAEENLRGLLRAQQSPYTWPRRPRCCGPAGEGRDPTSTGELRLTENVVFADYKKKLLNCMYSM